MAPLAQVKHLNQVAVGLGQRVRRKTVAGNATLAKLVQRSAVQVAHPNARHRRVVPVAAVLAEQELVQRGPPQDLLGATAPVVVVSLIANRIWIGGYLDSR